MNNSTNKITARIGLNLQSRQARVVFTLCAVGAYILAFIPLYPLVGSGVTALSVFPVIAAGWLFGLRIGLLSGLLSFFLNTLLLNFSGQEPGGWGVILYSGDVPETIVTVLIGVIIGRFRDLGHELKRQRDLAEALRETGIALNTTLELDELFDQLLDQIARVVPYDSANLTLIESGYTHITRMRGYEQFGQQVVDSITNISFDISAVPHLRSMAQTGQPVVISDTTADSNWVVTDTPIVIHSWAGAPMMSHGQMVAFLSLDKRESGFYRPEHAERLAMFANQAALALENAHLFNAEARRRREAELLHETTVALTSALDLKGVLDNILTQLEQVISYDSACVFLHQEDKLQAVGARGFADLDQVIGQDYPADDTLFEELRRTKQPLLLPDTQIDPRFQEWGNSSNIRGWMGVPLIVQQKIIGYLTLDSQQVGAYSQEDTTLVQTFANQAAVAIVNTQLFEQTQVALAQSEALYQATRTLITLTNLPEMLQSLVDRVAEMLPANRVSLITVDLQTRQMLQVVMGGPGVDKFIPLSFDEHWGGLTGWALRTREATISPKGKRDQRQSAAIHQLRIKTNAGATITVPLLYRDEVLGVMIAINSMDEPDFMQHDVELMMVIANQAAIAIENARLFEATQEARQLSDALREIEASLTATLDLEEVLNRILDGLGKVVPFTSASLMLREGNILRMKAARGLPDDNPAWLQDFVIKEGSVDHDIYKHKKTIIIPDVHQDPRFIQIEGTEYIRSWLGIPLIARDHVIGVLNLDQDQSGFYTEEHATIASAFAQQAAIALENARLFDETFRSAQQLTILNELAAEMTGLLEVQELCITVVERLHSVFNYYNVAIFTADLETQELVVRINAGAYADLAQPGEYRQAIGEGIIGQAAETGQVIIVNDTRQHPEFFELMETNIRSEMAIPLKVGTELIGVMNVDSDQLNAFDNSTVAGLRTIADQLAVALEKARLFAETQQWAEQLEALRQASLSVTSSLELKAVLETILKSALELISEVGNTNLFLYQSDILIFGAALSKDGRKSKPFAEPRKDGLTYTVARQGKAIVVSNIRAHPLFVNAPSNWTGAIIGLPLKIGQRVVGVMNVASKQPQTWLEGELRALELLADQAAIAIENARLFEAEQAARQQAEALREETRQNLTLIMRLYELSTEFVSSLSLEMAANLVIEKVVQATNAHSSVLNLLDEQSNHEQAFGPQEPPPRPSGTTMTIVKTSQPLVVSDTEHSPHLIHPQLVSTGIRAFIGLPLKAGDQIIGVLFVRYAQPHKFSDREMETLFIFANQAAIAIQNARLYEKEQRIQKRIQQQERMAAVGQLAAGIAHDFNNILTSIIGYAELLLVDPSLSPAAQEDVGRITKQGQRAAHLVRQILDFSRQTISAKQSLDLLPLIQETINLLERTIREDIHISLDAEPRDYTISGDLTQMQQALTNLAVNARDAMPTGGNLKFQLSQFELHYGEVPPYSDLSPGNWIALSISDTGIGIPPELHQQIFEPFFTTKEVGEGTGLGLAQVYGIIRQHDGFIDVKSEPELGATFTLYFPALLSPEVRSQEATMELPRGGNELILVVEDDSSVLTITTNMLEHLGYRVLTATNGYQALQVYDKHQREIALVLTDMTMPQMGGTELTLALRKRNSAIKIVVLTGYPLESEGKEALTQGIIDWLQKPFSIKDLAHTVSRSLSLKEETF